MKLKKLTIYCLALFCSSSSVYAQSGEEVQKKRSGNPIFPGWYADPEGVVLDGKFWIYPTYSAPYDEQTFMDAYSSPDLVHWTKHPRVLSKENIPWLRRALWAPAVIEANDRYYLFFGGNDIQNNSEIGGIGVAVADNPAGPFKDVLGKPLIDKIVNGAQPIDQFVFRDDDGTYYMYYGGWGHCNIVKLSSDLLSVVPFDDGTVYKEVTPQDYVEGPFMLKRNGKYYFMWSEGGWGSPDYRVPMPLPTLLSGRSIARESFFSRMPMWLPVPDIIQWCVEKVRTNGTSFTTVARWEKRQQTAVPPALTGCTLTKKER